MYRHLASFARRLALRRRRSFVEFAEQEVVLPTGPRAGLRFRTDFMPWTRLLLEAFDSDRWRRFFISGSVQSGKTLLAFQIPVLYHLFEMEDNIILGAPNVEMGQAIYEERLRPVIQASRYGALLPDTGAGSRGGRALAIRFANGASLRFMGAGGGDEQRSSHTARVVILTEIDKMDEPGEVSREDDPVTQIEARTSAYGSRARIYAECTMSVEAGRVYREIVGRGTDGRILIRCPHCDRHVFPDRDTFSGWQERDQVLDARSNATFACPDCGASWSEDDRRLALAGPVIAHAEGKQTDTFGLRWNAMHSGLLTMADIAEQEWRAEQSGSQRAVMQFVWALPCEEDAPVDQSGLSRALVAGKVGDGQRGTVPEGSRLTLFVDLGLYQCHWAALAWAPGMRGTVVDYGIVEVPQDRQPERSRVLTALREFRDEAIAPGWGAGTGTARPEMVLVDSGWEPDIAYALCDESRHVTRFVPTKGYGTSRHQQAWHPPKDTAKGMHWALTTPKPGVRLLVFDADHYKGEIHKGLAAPKEAAGSIGLFHAETRDLLPFIKQLLSERMEEQFVPGKGVKTFWNRLSKSNHWFDCVTGCRLAADVLGVTGYIRPEGGAPKKMAGYQRATGGSKWTIGR